MSTERAEQNPPKKEIPPLTDRQRIVTAEANARLLSAAPELLAACEMILDVRTCMLLQGVHADFLMHEILDKHDVPSVQLLAKKAQDLARLAVAKATGGGPDAARPAPAAE